MMDKKQKMDAYAIDTIYMRRLQPICGDYLWGRISKTDYDKAKKRIAAEWLAARKASCGAV